MNITNDKIMFFDILSKQYYDIGNKMKEFTFISKNNYWKYYDTIDPNYNLFPNDKLPQIKTHKIRIESYQPFPLEILNMDVFFKDQDNVKTKYMPEFSSNPYTFKNSKQSSTSNIEHKASKAVNGELNSFSQTTIEFNNNLKWFEVSLNPPNIITSIEFYARENISFKNRINNVNIFLIDENGKKINWKWKQTSLDDSTKKIILEGKSSVLSDKLDNPQIFEEIDSTQPFSYYPQNYIEKISNTLIYRIGNNTYNWNINNLQKWDDIYLPLQKIKKEYTDRYNKNLIDYGFYILPDSKWNYNWINNGKLGIDSINNGLNDVLNVYSTDINNDKSSLIFTYIYDGTSNNYYLNGNLLSNQFIKKNNNIANDEISIYLVDDINYQHNIIREEIFTKKENAAIKKNKQDRLNKRIKDGEYLIVNRNTNNIKLIVSHPIVSKFNLDDNFNILNDKKTKNVKTIKFTVDKNIVDSLKYYVYDIDDYIISDKNITYENSSDGKKFIKKIILSREQQISGIKIKKLNVINKTEMKIELLSVKNNLIDFKLDDSIYPVNNISYDDIRLNKIDIEPTIVNNKQELEELAVKYEWNEINDIEPTTEELSYRKIESIETNKNIQLDETIINISYNESDRIKVINNKIINLNDKTLNIFDFTKKRNELLTIKETIDERIRSQIPGVDNEEFYVYPYNNETIDIINTNTDGAFKIIKSNNNSFNTISINDDLNPVPDINPIVYIWNNGKQRYENGNDFFVMRFSKTANYKLDILTIIYGNTNIPSTSYKTMCIRYFPVVYEEFLQKTKTYRKKQTGKDGTKYNTVW